MVLLTLACPFPCPPPLSPPLHQPTSASLAYHFPALAPVSLNAQGYEELAVGLGIDTERRLTLRRALADARASCALFDTELWVRDLQRGLRLMWQQHCAGAQPEDIDVPNVEQHSR